MSSAPESSTIGSTGLNIGQSNPSEFELTLDGRPFNALGISDLFNLGALWAAYSPNETTHIFDSENRRADEHWTRTSELGSLRRGNTEQRTTPIYHSREPEVRFHTGWITFREFDSFAIGNLGRIISSNSLGLTKSIFAGESARAYATETVAEGVTDFPGVDHLIESVISFTLRSIMSNPHEEIYEDGMESELSRKLHAMVRDFGPPCVDLLNRLLNSNTINCEVASEVLRQVGLIKHPQTHADRLFLLTSALKFQDPRLRDAASIGLASMDDPAALPALEAALSAEPSLAIRRNLNLVVKQFRVA